jgi:outer membrane protein
MKSKYLTMMLVVIFSLFSALGSVALAEELRLTLEQAVQMALSNNPDIRSANYDLEIAKNEIIRAKATYDPYIQLDTNYSSSRRPTSQPIFGRESETASATFSSGVQVPTGGSLSVDFRNTRQESDSEFMTLNPSYNTDMSLGIRQPILKNSFKNLRQMDLTQKENDYRRAELALKSKTMEVTASVEDAYWSLVKSKKDLEVRRQSLEVTRRLDEVTKAQVESGVLAPVAVVQSEASLASAQANLIRSEGDYQRSQNNLKMLLYFKSEDDLRRIEINPVDEPIYEEFELDPERSIELAVVNNISLEQARLSLENLKISNQQTKNRRLPQLDLNANVTFSGLAGVSNTDPQSVQTGFVVPNPFPTPQPYILETISVTPDESEYEGGYNEALENMLDMENMSYSAGLLFKMPIGNRAARSDWRKAKYNLEKMELDLGKQKRSIVFSMESLINDVRVAHRSFEAARLARELEEKSLATEENKYRLGLNTHYQVMEADERFADAKTSEIAALIEYNKALGRLKRAEQGYLQAAGGVGVTVPGISMAGATSTAGGGLPAGLSSSQLQSLMNQLPPGVDLSQLEAMGLSIP